MNRDYLTTADVIGIHAVLLHRYGGAEGIRDMGAVESAVFRPQCGYYSDIAEEAAALLESLLINHPFIDGNKRTAFAACDIFLRINGMRITAENERLYALMLRWISLEPAQRFDVILQELRQLIK
jgi:death on curing protein